jgi:hypothetical protein
MPGVWNSRYGDLEAMDDIFVFLLVYLNTTFDYILWKQVETIFVIIQEGKKIYWQLEPLPDVWYHS